MLRVAARFILMAAAIFLAACSAPAFCQASPFDHVPNLPYTAQGLQTLDDGDVRRETRTFQARDSQGRTRIETCSDSPCGDPGDPRGIVTLYVPLHRQFIQLNPVQKVARVMTFPGTGPIPTHGPNLKAIKTTTESLPGQMINGIYAVGTRTTEVIPSDEGRGPDIVNVAETWFSPDLKILLLFKYESTDPSSANTTWEIRQLDRTEPQAALFEIPADYKIMTVSTEPQTDR